MNDHPFNLVYVAAQIGYPALFITLMWLAVKVIERLDRRHEPRIFTYPEHDTDVAPLPHLKDAS